MVTNFDSELAEPNRWPVDDEVHLLYSTLDNKPVGIDRHFQMSIIWDKFVTSSSKPVNSDVLWRKLNTLYNLKSLDDSEILPFNNKEEEFKLPVELIPEQFFKMFSDEEKKNVDVTGTLKKYLSLLIESEEDDSDTKTPFKLKGNERVKWFENPQHKGIERSHKKCEETYEIPKIVDDSDTKKVIRQYGKAGEVSSGTIVTLNIASEQDESSDNLENKEEEAKNTTNVENKNVNSDRVVKIKRTRSNKQAKTETSNNSDVESAMKQSKLSSVETIASTTRSRKASIVSQESYSNVEIESKTRSPVTNAGDEVRSGVKRRFSQRCSVSESKNEPSVKSEANKVEIKKKNLGRR